ncbi:hypothetical protein Tco_0949843 [Tanacetum coccineum]
MEQNRKYVAIVRLNPFSFRYIKEVPEQELCSDDESIKANEEANNLNLDDENDSEGSLLEVLDGMIKVGQTMGFSMDGCLKDMKIIIGSQGDREGFQ